MNTKTWRWLMPEEPDIIRELRSAEKAGQFYKDTLEPTDINKNDNINNIIRELFESNDELDDMWFGLWRVL